MRKELKDWIEQEKAKGKYTFICPKCKEETINHPLYPGASVCCGRYSCCQENEKMTDQLQACGCKFEQIRDDINGKMVYNQTVWCADHKPPPAPAPPPPPLPFIGGEDE